MPTPTNQHQASTILGIDPGLRKTGWGIIKKNGSTLKFIACGQIKPDEKAPLYERLRQLSQGLQQILLQYNPDHVAVEETFVSQNGQSTLKLGQARGALIVTAANHGLKVSEYAPTLVKKSIVGVGRAEKNQVIMMVQMLLPKAVIESEDAADALAVAITHGHHFR